MSDIDGEVVSQLLLNPLSPLESVGPQLVLESDVACPKGCVGPGEVPQVLLWSNNQLNPRVIIHVPLIFEH